MTTKIDLNKIFLIFLGLLTVLLAYVIYPDFIGDDTFIHIGFIKDLCAGKGYSFAGTKTYGTTSPLWVLLGTFVSKVFASPEISVRFMSAVFTLTTVYMLYFLLIKINIDSKIVYAGVLSLIFNPFFLRWALTGMEVTLAMSLLLLVYYLFVINEKPGLINWGGIVIGLGVLVRPEFLGFLIILFGYLLVVKSGNRKKYIIPFLLAIIMILAWLIFSYYYFGTIIPNTYLAKAGNDLVSFQFEFLTRTLKLFTAGNFPEFILILIIALLALYVFIKRGNNFKFIRFLTETLLKYKLVLPLLWIAGFYIFYILKDVIIISRYSLILVPFIILISISVLNEIKKYLNITLFRFVIILYVSATLVVFCLMTFFVVKPASDDFVYGFQQSYKDIALIIKEDSSGREKSIALTDVGMIGCYSGARIYDFIGLVDRSRFEYKNNRDYLISKRADYLVLREEYDLEDILPQNVRTEILYQKNIGGFGINESNRRTVTLYKLYW